MLNQKKVEIFLVKIRKSLAKQFLEIATRNFPKKIAFKRAKSNALAFAIPSDSNINEVNNVKHAKV